MQHSKSKLIALDSDPVTLRQIAQTAGQWYEVFTTSSARQAIAWLREKQSISVLISEHVTQKVDGSRLLKTAQVEFPEIRRIVMLS